MTEEIWKDISGYEGKYQVSNLGRVKSLNYLRTCKEQFLKSAKNKKGYLHVTLSLNNKQKNFLVHRLVAETFIPNPDNLEQVNHKDENKQNNCAQNLEWCTCKYNNRYGTKLKRLSKKVGCFKDNQLIKIYNAIKDTELDGFNNKNVCSCCKGKLKSSGGFTWRYLEN